ncbi:acetyl-coenzyme A carboxylase carboxyl transferase subunit beta [Clostridium aceticum]|uniref:Acetyl-coenzyme A carboxylase carboxyl transferase subunit beta n=1 Tax=Clostridium aceticum TaxID=84022 RepID=A0A0D8I8Y5_9CLOT|nr:acetyl-CoA carboxylase, carboxyltransferase subunit beta [Clostridium aceticum]AKL95695.1 acetyl-coenzyme A carboxylase carboxyl transferase subunit beta [Clostridium aceticum]KJF26750.1 acetyl-CoA carboxylase subunit beta [Clostridium aceticum]
MLKDLFSKKKYAPIVVSDQQQKKKSTSTNTTKPAPVSSQKVEKLKGIGARDRIKELIDEGTFVEYDIELKSADPLNFPDYANKVTAAMTNTNENEVVITGEGKIQGRSCILCVMDPNFIMGSMGSVVGEKITRAIEKAIENKLPVIIFCASGGARMQEGILSLMQMAKTSAALARLSEEGLLYISVLTDPTTGGVTASFAMLGDIILAEPGALIGFAGPRVIEQTIRQKLPEGFQKAEFLKAKGFVDKIVDRKDMRSVLSKILKIHAVGGEQIDA